VNESPDERFMRAALAEARKGIGLTSPNPNVGAVLVRGGKIVAAGHHRRAGAPHAEVECLRNFGKTVPADATLYVTLEPCSTEGRTGRCTDAIVAAGVRHVVVGAVDVNPLHVGRGVNILRQEGVNVTCGILEAECTSLNEAFNKWIKTRRPLVIAKCGMSIDGRLTRPPDEEQWLTSPVSRRHANRFRAQVDAILVGAETLRRDNPQLTVRTKRGARQPWRVVLTRSGRLPKDAHLFTDAFADRTIVLKHHSLGDVLDELGARQITSVLIEGGGEVLSQALDEQLIDRVRIYVAPLMTGGPVFAFAGRGVAKSSEALRIAQPTYHRIGHDVFIEGKAAYGTLAAE
jgi:diaminohydroxyphosphoribosylaminopyrimidine deaminase / 5-amino-6-(5-phosphoribosylamino)uracil reductase